MLHHKFMMTISTLLKSKIWTLHAKTKFLNDGKQRQLYFNVNMQDFIAYFGGTKYRDDVKVMIDDKIEICEQLSKELRKL